MDRRLRPGPVPEPLSSPFDETVDIKDRMERAKSFAATQVELGLDRTMISSMSIPARMADPAVGADFSPDRLALAIESCGIICQILQSEGPGAGPPPAPSRRVPSPSGCSTTS
jgi:inosose dehydratase